VIQRFGEKLRALRMRHGMTMQQLADALGYTSTGHISDIETNRRQPTAELAVKTALLFNVTTDQLLRDDLELDGEE